MKKHAILSPLCNPIVIFSIGLASGLGQCLPAPEGLIGLWAGDGNANDLFQDHHGTLAGNASANTAGYVNQCFRFDGTNGFVSIPDAPELRPTNLTIEAWVRFDGLTSAVAGPPAGYQYLVFKKNTRGDSFEGFSLQKSAANAFEFVVTSAGGDFRRVTSSSLIVTGAWFHVAGVRGPDFIRLYVNGALAGQTAVTAPQDYDSTPIYFGTTGLAYDARLKGSLDEVTLYSRALSAPELDAIFVAGANGKCKSGLNDHFANRRTISGMSNTVYATSATATKESGEPAHAGAAGGHSLWWTWTAPMDATMVLGTVGSDFDTLLAVYTGNEVQALNDVASDDQHGGDDTSLLTFQASAGVPYQIAVDGWQGAAGNVVLNLRRETIPPQIDSQPVSRIASVGGTVSFTVHASGTLPLSYQWTKNGVALVGETNQSYDSSYSQLYLENLQLADAGNYTVVVTNAFGSVTSSVAVLTVVATPPNDLFTNRIYFPGVSNTVFGSSENASYTEWLSSTAGDVWWAWVAPTNGRVTVDTFGSSFNTVLTVYAGSENDFLIGQPNFPGNNNRPLVFDAFAGAEYAFRVGGYGYETGNIVLNLRMSFIPPQFTNQPQSQLVATGQTTTLSAAATGSPPLYFQWRKNGLNLPGQTNSWYGYDAYLVLANVQTANAGNYSVLVSNSYGSVTSTVATLTVTNPPTNDAFANRVPLSGRTNLVSGHNAGATKEYWDNEPDHAGDLGGASVWWSWQAPVSGYAAIDTSGSAFNTVLAVYTGNAVSNLAVVATNNDFMGTASRVFFYAIGGTNYQIAVDGFRGDQSAPTGQGTVALNIRQPASLAPEVLVPPQSQSALTGGAVMLEVAVAGAPMQFGYQWQFNGSNLTGQTNAALSLTNLAEIHGGEYRVVITNTAGAVTSSVALLNVAASGSASFVSGWPGYRTGAANSVNVVGSFAYLGTDAGLMVLDVSDPARPRRVGGFDTDSPVVRLTVAGGYAHIITASNSLAEGTLSRIDVRNPTLPRRVKHRVFNQAKDVAVANGAIILGDGAALRVLNTNYDIVASHTSTNPAPVQRLFEENGYIHASFFGYDSQWNWLQRPFTRFDFSDPGNPIAIELPASAQSWSFARPVLGKYLYEAHGAGGGAGVEIYDLTNPLHTWYRSSIHIGRGLIGDADVVLLTSDSRYAYVAAWGGVDAGESMNGFAVYDLLQSANPTLMGVTRFVERTRDLAVAGNFLYLACGDAGLLIYDVSDPATPQAVGRFSSALDAARVRTQGNFAYVLDRNAGFHIIDIQNPNVPVFVSSYSSPEAAVGLDVRGRYAYLSTGQRLTNATLDVVDVIDPAHPARIGRAEILGSVPFVTSGNSERSKGDVEIVGNIGLVSMSRQESSHHLWTCDLSDPRSPRLMGGQRLHPFFYGTELQMSVAGSRALLLTHDAGFGDPAWTLDSIVFSDPANPAFTRLLSSTQAFNFVGLAENTCYLNGAGASQIWDVSNEALPTDLTPGYAPPVSFIAGQQGYGCDSLAGFVVSELSLRSKPVAVASYPGVYGQVTAQGRYALVAGNSDGLTILDLGLAMANAPEITAAPVPARAVAGTTASFYVGVKGTPPLAYQWFYDGAVIPGATGAALTLSNVQSSQAGEYSVVVSNSVGVVVGTNAVLTVDLPPEIQLLSPSVNQHLWPGSNLLVSAMATDPDATNGWSGYVAKVDFYTNGILWTAVSNSPPFTNSLFSVVWSNLPPGNHTVRAVATDNEGATNTSALVNIVVTNQRAFQLTAANYPVIETNGVVTVTVRRNLATNSASVTLFTENATAFAAPPGGIGSYYALTNVLTFPIGVVATNVQVTLVNDLVNRGDRQFVVRLSNPSSGWQLFNPSNAYVTIIDDDPLTNNFADVALPPAGAVGALRVTLQPTNALGKWRFWWESDWRDSGSAVSNLAVGDYTLEYLARSGFIAPATSVITISNAGAFFSYTNYYTNLFSAPQTGGLAVTILPPEVATAGNLTNRGQWRLSGGNTNWNNGGFLLTNLLAGAHLVEFKPIPGYETPPRQVMYVNANGNLTYQSTYVVSSAPVANGPVPLDSYNTITNDAIQPGTPYRFAGQIISDVGLSSGFVVKPRTVLTAAHAVFDVNRLTFSTNVWWFFQRHRGEHESLAQQPRGWHVFSSYAAARTNDPSPIESSIETRNLDVAALYFFEDAGRGGYGGYLITSTNGQWLDSSLLKLMVGYPVDGVPESHRGQMHQVGPFFAAFQKLTNQVYRSDQVVSYGGHSGGPVCVLSTNSSNRAFFIPAGIYLGGSGETVVRAIDLDVVDLINRAQNSASGGTNNTGGGVIVWTATGGTGFIPGLFRVNLSPTNLIAQGAGWRVKAGPDTNWISNDALYYPLLPGPFVIEFNSVSGYRTPTELTVNLTANQTTVLDVSYAAVAPSLFSAPTLLPNGSLRLTLVGSSGNVYAIQTSSNLVNWTDLLFLTNTTGTNFFTNTPAIGVDKEFFRARQLP